MSIDYAAIGTIIIDDIVDPQGHSNMGTLGGGGTHAVSGMRVWSEKTALVGVIGQNFPQSAWQQLTALANPSGIITRNVPQPRAWQLFESDGTRNEVFRTDFKTFSEITIRPKEYPADFDAVKGVYIQTATPAEAERWASRLREVNPDTVILWEPWEVMYRPENLDSFCRVAPQFEVISPQTKEIKTMLGQADPERQADLLLECGVRCLALRMGAAGSLVATPTERHRLPAAPATVVDETGAGNAYCGGFVVGYVESGGDARVAGRYAAVSATFALGQIGVARLGLKSRALAEQRLSK